MVTLDLRSPSAAMLRLEMDSDVRVSTTATDVRFAGQIPGSRLPGSFTLQFGTLGFQDVANEALMPARVTDRFVVDGNEVRLAVGVEGVNATVAVIGQWHEAMFVYGGPPPRREEVLETVTLFAFEDSPNGMSVRSRSSGLEQLSETVKIVVDDRGSISVFGQRNSRASVPAHAGARTKYGEVWRLEGQLPDREGQGANTYLYLIGTTTAFAEVVMDYEPVVDDETLLRWLETINLAWH